MTARDLTPSLRQAGYEHFLPRSLCPNSGNPCEHISKLLFAGRVAQESAEMTSQEGHFRNVVSGVAEQAAVEVRQHFDVAMQDTNACLGRCAVAQSQAAMLEAHIAPTLPAADQQSQ